MDVDDIKAKYIVGFSSIPRHFETHLKHAPSALENPHPWTLVRNLFWKVCIRARPRRPVAPVIITRLFSCIVLVFVKKNHWQEYCDKPSGYKSLAVT